MNDDDDADDDVDDADDDDDDGDDDVDDADDDVVDDDDDDDDAHNFGSESSCTTCAHPAGPRLVYHPLAPSF